MAGYVVKATSPAGSIDWISPRGFGGLRVHTSKEMAEVFETQPEAQAAIESMMPLHLKDLGMVFSVEPKT
jgi:hypothetical protein